MLYNYDKTYSNLDLTLLDDEELYSFAVKLVRHFLQGLYLIGFTDRKEGSVRIFDIEKHELSEIALLSSDLLDGYGRRGRKVFQDKVDMLLFQVSLFQGNQAESVSLQIKQLITKEMRDVIRETLDKRT